MINLRVIVFTGFVGLLVALGFMAADRSPSGNFDGVVLAQSNSGQNPMRQMMRDMMRQMMQGLVPPPGMTAERLPDSGSQGAQLVAQYCGQCHDLPSPVFHTAGEWPSVFERMLSRMEMMSGGMKGGGMMSGGMMGMGRVEAPSTKEADALLTYLQDHGMRRASPQDLAKGDLEDRRIFLTECARCHALPSPSMHRAEEWLAVVARMQGNMALMKRPVINNEAREAIVRFLQQATAGHAPRTD